MRESFQETLSSMFCSLAALGCPDAELDEYLPLARVPPTVDDDQRLAALELSSTRVHVQTVGNPRGRVLIFLHGGPGDDFRSLCALSARSGGRSLTDDHRIVLWDQRGAGQSRRHPAHELTLERYARDLEELIDHYSPAAPVALLGHGWGASYAARFLRAHPARAYAAALLEPCGSARALGDERGVRARETRFEELVRDPLSGRNVSAQQHARADHALRSSLDRARRLPCARYGALAKRELTRAASEGAFDFVARLDRLPFEPLVLMGAEHHGCEPARQQRQRAARSHCRLEYVAGAGRDLLGARAEAVIPRLLDYFLSRAH